MILDAMTSLRDPSYPRGDPFSPSLFRVSWRTLVLRLTQLWGSNLPMPTWMGAPKPSTMTMSMDPWHP